MKGCKPHPAMIKDIEVKFFREIPPMVVTEELKSAFDTFISGLNMSTADYILDLFLDYPEDAEDLIWDKLEEIMKGEKRQ